MQYGLPFVERSATSEDVVGDLDVGAALSRVTLVPAEDQVEGGIIAPRFEPLENRADFIDVVESVDLLALPMSEAITVLSAAAARSSNRLGVANCRELTAATLTRWSYSSLKSIVTQIFWLFVFDCWTAH